NPMKTDALVAALKADILRPSTPTPSSSTNCFLCGRSYGYGGPRELLRELVPGATRVAVLVNPANPATETTFRDLEPAARAMGLQLHQGRHQSGDRRGLCNLCARAARRAFRRRR